MALAVTYRRVLRERALDQHGYITTRDAKALGVPPVELPKLAARGGLCPVAYGVYRFEDIPPGSHDGYMEAVLATGSDAHLYADAVLALHGLALVNPTWIKVATPRPVRRTLPKFVQAVRVAIPPEELTEHDGIPATTVARALRDCRNLVMGERLIDATREAQSRGLVTPREAASILQEYEQAPDA